MEGCVRVVNVVCANEDACDVREMAMEEILVNMEMDMQMANGYGGSNSGSSNDEVHEGSGV